ncbi:MAG: hypothetical protein J3K34DRAFT_434893 [Monoraphidium minutum]|nr:MAG: hypothetical protein J3K34DRAFT_434893 [Monoraphidium minutum]
MWVRRAPRGPSRPPAAPGGCRRSQPPRAFRSPADNCLSIRPQQHSKHCLKLRPPVTVLRDPSLCLLCARARAHRQRRTPWPLARPRRPRPRARARARALGACPTRHQRRTFLLGAMRPNGASPMAQPQATLLSPPGAPPPHHHTCAHTHSHTVAGAARGRRRPARAACSSAGRAGRRAAVARCNSLIVLWAGGCAHLGALSCPADRSRG